MTIYKYLKKYLGGLTLMLLVFSYSYSLEFESPYQKYVSGAIKRILDGKYYIIMPENDWKTEELKGKIKTKIETIYSYSNLSENNEVEKTITKFNEDGYKIIKVVYTNGKETYSNKYKYNKNGLLIEDNNYTYTYKYDKQGNLVQTGYEKEDDKNLKKNIYNKEGKIIREQTFSQSRYLESEVEIIEEGDFFKDKNRKLYQRMDDLAYIYNRDGKLEEVRDNIYDDTIISYTYYENENGLYEKIIELLSIKVKYITNYDKDGNELYFKTIIKLVLEDKPKTTLYVMFKDIKTDKYGNLTYRVANRLEDDKTTGKVKDMGIYEKSVIKYEYYE